MYRYFKLTGGSCKGFKKLAQSLQIKKLLKVITRINDRIINVG